jgi:predicted outer membrane repeat protein
MNDVRESTTSRVRVRRAFAVWTIVVLGLAALVTVGAGNRPARAATNRFVATGGSDTNNDCSNQGSPCATIQHAVTQAASGDTINVAAGTYHENVTFFGMTLGMPLTIQGAGAGSTTVDGGNAAPVFTVGGANLTLSDLTITNGNGNNAVVNSQDAGGGITIAGLTAATVMRCTITGNTSTQVAGNNGRGGGIFSAGTLTVMDSTITNNSADATGGGIFGDIGTTATIVRCTVSGNNASLSGSGIYTNQGTLSLTDSTVSGNTAQNFGGGIYCNKGTLSLTRTTVSGNSAATGFGGGIYNNKGPTVSLTNSTISGNSANQGLGGGIYNNGSTVTIANTSISGNSAAVNSGGGIYLGGTSLNLTNTIIAGSTGGDCLNQGGTLATNSHNLIQDGSCSPMLSGDPKLGALQNNGGPTFTQALLAGSPAIDAGDDSVLGPPLSLTTDQRGPGFPRKSGSHVDIGAYEVQQAAGPTFNTCLKDNTGGYLIQWSSTTGAYKFTRCSDGFILSGTGTVSNVNGLTLLTDSKPDRKVTAGFSTSTLTGSATIYIQIAPGIWQTIHISATNPSAVCSC